MALTQVQGGMLQGSTNTTTTIQSNGTTAITIDSSQKVGIGTTSPTGKLHVYGSGEVQTLQRSSGSANNYTLFKTESGADQAYLGFSDGGVNNFAIYNVQNGYIRFGTNNAERMRITSAGEMLVGTNTQVGSGKTVIAYDSNTYVGIAINQTNTSSAGTMIAFRLNDVEKGSIYQNTSTVSYLTTSDYRLKENVAPMTGALAKITQLKPCTYTWKLDGSDGQGFIAHELQAVVPDCVTGEKDAVDEEGNPVHQGIDTSFLVATLTAAIQELKAELDATKAEVAALKAAP
jgi:hypothetical protein